MSTRAGEASFGAARCVPRYQRPLRPDRRVLRPSRRLALVRAQRGRRSALPVSRLEVRRDRPVYGSPFGARGERLLPEDQAQILSACEDRARFVDPYGRAGETAATAGIRVRSCPARALLHFEARAGV